jgi:hypothetical protein
MTADGDPRGGSRRPLTVGGVGRGTALALLLLAAPAAARAENIPVHMIPKPVLDAVGARFKTAKPVGAERDRDHRGFIYEVTLKQNGKNVDVTATPDGVILLIKREIAAADMPAPVLRALEEAYPGAAYEVVEAVTKVDGVRETLAHYEVELVTAQRRIVEVRLGVDGKVLEKQIDRRLTK